MNKLGWIYILSGVGLGVVLIVIDVFLKKISDKKIGLLVIVVGIGIYLLLLINMFVIIGVFLVWCIICYIVNYVKCMGNKDVVFKVECFGIFFFVGLIVGESLMGVVLVFVIVVFVSLGGFEVLFVLNFENWEGMVEVFGLVIFFFGLFLFVSCVLCVKRVK